MLKDKAENHATDALAAIVMHTDDRFQCACRHLMHTSDVKCVRPWLNVLNAHNASVHN